MDVDTGVDDALAIMLALHSPAIRLLGVTTVYGNTPPDQAALNTRFLLQRLGLEGQVPVIQGAAATLKRGVSRPASEIHGTDGLGGVYRRFVEAGGHLAPAPQYSGDAVDLILDHAGRFGRDLTLIATGPITNVALAFERAPEVFRRIGRLLIMSGAVEIAGNISPLAESNASRDPEALSLVLNAGVPTVLFPLDVTTQARLLSSALTEALGIAPDKLDLVRDLTRQYMDFHALRRGFHGAYVHDAMPVAYLIRPQLFRLKTGVVTVDCSEGPAAGRTRWAERGEPGAAISVALGVHEAAFFNLFWSELRRTPGAGYERLEEQ
jgi:purine nucleosidase